jgi:CheY-like chemotaxis protein
MGDRDRGYVQRVMQPRLLIVDDDPEMREALGDFFSRDGHACELAADASAALEAFDRQAFDVVICDVLMEGMNGLQLLDRIRKNHPTIPFIVITGKGGVSQAVAAIKRGAFEYMVKPCDGADLRRVVSDALDARRRPSKGARIATESGTATKQELLGSGPAMRALQTTVDFVARSSAPVLIVGETGVGKEIVARAIHARSVRHDSPRCANAPRTSRRWWRTFSPRLAAVRQGHRSGRSAMTPSSACRDCRGQATCASSRAASSGRSCSVQTRQSTGFRSNRHPRRQRPRGSPSRRTHHGPSGG